MNHLLRELAPFGDDAWAMLDAEARDRLVPALTARRVVDFDGPRGWQYSAVDLGRTEPVTGPDSRTEPVTGPDSRTEPVTGPDSRTEPATGAETRTEPATASTASTAGIVARRRRVLPLCEVRATFTVRLEEMVDFSRGATDVDLTDLDQAALRLAAHENRATLRGWTEAGITGVGAASTQRSQTHDGTPESFRTAVTAAVAALRDAGVAGPYALACGPVDWAEIVETDDGGYPLRKQLEGITGGDVERTPGIDESVLISQRGGDFVLTVGEDLSLGYLHHDADAVTLYVEESFAFRVNTPEAAVVLRRAL
ncbi:family 1 encapsulin nanocompartment shell protein [Curtobacterium sp. PhB115]|uniref:family 1 encapsulin nanocompartment shell protein n=1 Tax=Curtobacterium sp. PhB115 TaxID=2485173 RepID=UPI000F4B1ACC|nr:family 1 encapsulin nanocompartment shell protein [Curtobacterium sp. PhB115]ROP65464.1 putative linocin/CFP29 family protein [Curtobacterium sp. PhB115]